MHFGPSHLKKMTLLFPPSLEKQMEFDNFIATVDNTKLTVKQGLDKLELVKQSLMQQYFG